MIELFSQNWCLEIADESMEIAAVIAELKSLASIDTREMSERRGVPEETLLGVSSANLRKLAEKLGRNNELANQLWRESFHEAHLLAILIAPLSEKSAEQLTSWVSGIDSWSICDQFAKRLSEELESVSHLVSGWAQDEALYVRRSGLALLANHCMKQHRLEDEVIQEFISLIERTSNDPRQHVKQACCWALRELGKIDTETHEIATNLALELMEASDSTSVWVGKCSYKELELLVKIPARRRLISRKSKTASKYHS